MARPQDSGEIYPRISPARRKRPAAYLGVTCEKAGAEYRLRWVDPESGRRASERLPSGLSAKERAERRQTKAAELNAQRSELEQRSDRKRHGALTVDEAVAHYFQTKRLTPGTRAIYAPVAENFRAFCAANCVRTVRELQRRHLRAWRAERLQANKLTAKPGGRRGEQHEAGARSAASANRELRALSAILNHLRDDDLLRLSSDDIRTGLAREKHEHNLRDFLAAPQLRELLRIAARHDAQTYRLTRDGRRDVPKYTPVTPFLRAAALTGMRLEEMLGLRWEHVVGDRIHLPAEIAKGGRARVIDLSVSPSALPEQQRAGSVFGLTLGEVVAARKRLLAMGAPPFHLHALRRTCGTYLACSSIYGTAGVYLTARRLGHSVAVAERHYLGVVSVDPDAKTLEAALGFETAYLAAAQANVVRAMDAHLDAIREFVGNELAAKIEALLAEAGDPPKA